MSQGPWAIDSRSVGIGIAIGLSLALTLATVGGFIWTSLHRPTHRGSRSRSYKNQTRTRTQLATLSFNPPKLAGSKVRHAPTTGERLSLESHMVVAPARSPSPEFILDIAPRKAHEPSPSSPSTQLEPPSQFDLDLEAMRATNTFSGLPASSNGDSSLRKRPTSSPMDDSINVFELKPKQIRHKRLSELSPEHTKSFSAVSSLTTASAVVRRVQSADFVDSSTLGADYELYPRLAPSKLEMERELSQQWERPRGMGHTLPRPQTAKTVSSRPGTGVIVPQASNGNGNPVSGMTSSSSFTPFSSSSSLGLPLNQSPTTSGSDPSSRPTSHYPPPQLQTRPLSSKEMELGLDPGNSPLSQPTHRRRRNQEKSSQSSFGLSKPSPALIQDSYSNTQHPHSRPLPQHPQSASTSSLTYTHPQSHTHSQSLPLSHSQSQMNNYDNDSDIAPPPPYNVANVHSHSQRRGNDTRMRERSDSRSGEMGFGQGHHARNHLL